MKCYRTISTIGHCVRAQRGTVLVRFRHTGLLRKTLTYPPSQALEPMHCFYLVCWGYENVDSKNQRRGEED